MPKVRPLTEAGRDKERDATFKKTVYEKKGETRFEDIAAKCGITRYTLYQYLNHPGWMPIQTYRDICRAVGMEVML